MPQLYLFIVSVVVLVVNGFHSHIKHYPNVTLDTCGIGRQSLLTTGQCLRWEFNANSTTSNSIQYGRLADPGEWPWVVYISGLRYLTNPFYRSKHVCSGVILNQLWVITAAHYTPSRRLQYDIALIRLQSPGIQMMTLNSDGGYYTVNGICLTNENIANNRDELALFAGFGDTDNFVQNDGPLRMGWIKIHRHILKDRYGTVIKAHRYPTQIGTGLCDGDSGGPLIQYAGGIRLGYEEKAVLIGISAGAHITVVVVVNGLHSGIKQYPNVTLDTCGIGRQSLLTTGQCFNWSSNVITSSVQNGRLAKPGEWPWIVYYENYNYFLGFIRTFRLYCNGIILNHKWILTAAHCLDPAYTITVRTVQDRRDNSHTYSMDKRFIHPDYRSIGSDDSERRVQFDLALIKLAEPGIVEWAKHDGYYTVNSICLPDNGGRDDGINRRGELGLYAGYGFIREGTENDGPLRMGWLIIQPYLYNAIFAMKYPSQSGTNLCQGDSGGPLIQYVTANDGSRRAVLIGIYSGGTNSDSSKINSNKTNRKIVINKNVIENSGKSVARSRAYTVLAVFAAIISLYFLPVWQHIDHWLTFNLDIDRNTSEIVKSRGFQSETHYVETADGYHLTVIRIVNPYVRNRLLLKPILLQHGFQCSSDTWLIASMGQLTREGRYVEDWMTATNNGHNKVGNSLGFVLAANGYDVWLANMRGNRYSLNHTSYISDDTEFWRFSIDEMIEYDLPAMIEYIKKQTKKDEIGYIGHSQGTYMMFSLLATQPHYSDTIKPFIAISPVPYMGNATSLLVKLGQYVYPLLRRSETSFLLVERPLKFYAKLCDTTYWAQVVCHRIFYLLLGFQSSQWNMTRTGVYISNIPSGSSSWNAAHLLQSSRSNRPERYNHWDSRDNERQYNSDVPLAYDMEAINSTDIALIYTANDWLNHVDDVRLLKDHLKVKLLDDYLVPDSTWNHMELLMGTGAGQYVNVRVLDLLAKY
ncbi:uncharacterized protein LOC128954432 [Oppia nitens]|uniref:uncharacterized protein LOC128954432 n=1 Tax=Oppia nitens TaxID=1686743 RepID=UPI0023DA3ADE|nr:uncharacterized protein LOC128954432 [Oppia nitens]